MFQLKKPTNTQLELFLVQQATVNFSYNELGATDETPPKNYTLDHNQIKLGEGLECFAAAKEAIDSWVMFSTPFTQLYPIVKPKQDDLVVVVARHLGFYSLNPSRVVYLVNRETDHCIEYGFAYGTLVSHAERGEERFLVKFNKGNKAVHYDLLAFSRPNHWLVRLGYPYARFLQKSFAQASLKAMFDFVNLQEQT